MKRSIRRMILAAALASLLFLTGCTLGSSVESLFTLPQLPEKYRQLSAVLESLLDAGNTYITPAEGVNIESVQMVDLDGDSEKEAVVLLQHNGDSKPLKVMVFRQTDSDFKPICTIESAGTGIDRIDYPDMNCDGVAELVIGWRGEEDQRRVCVYRMEQADQPLLKSEYEEYLLADLVGDGTTGLFLLREDSETHTAAECYIWQNSMLRLNRTCRINSDIDAIHRGSVVSGYLQSGVPAVFVTGVQDKDTATTAVLVWKSGNMVNVASENAAYRYCHLDPQDIDGDGATEIPCRLSPVDDAESSTGKDMLVNWLRYDEQGEAKKAAETYHCQSYGWYMTCPEEYWDQITVNSRDMISGENRVEFSLRGIPFAALYSITCENRESRAQIDTRFIVKRLPGTIYAGEIYDVDTDNGEAVEAFRQNFSLIVDTWDTAGKE